MANGDLTLQVKKLASSVPATHESLGYADPNLAEWIRDEYIRGVGPEIACAQFGLDPEEWFEKQRVAESREREPFKRAEVISWLKSIRNSADELIRLLGKPEIDFAGVESELSSMAAGLEEVQFEVSLGKR